MKPLIILVVILIVGVTTGYLIRKRSLVPGNTKKTGADTHKSRNVAEITRPLQRPALLLRKSDSQTQSYFGGRPPAYDEFVWPTKKGQPLAFLACIDLGSLPSNSGIDWLPTEGRLLFFYDLDEQPWGFDPKDRGSWSVVYVPASTGTTGETQFPIDMHDDWQVEKRGIEFVASQLPPSWQHDEIEALKMSDAESDEFIECRTDLYGDLPHHQIGGYPDPIQGADMDLECQFASNGIYCGDTSAYEDPRAKELGKDAAEWQLLLQIDSDDDLGVMWGDLGMIYFWIRRDDARNCKFENAWLILQCG